MGYVDGRSDPFHPVQSCWRTVLGLMPVHSPSGYIIARFGWMSSFNGHSHGILIIGSIDGGLGQVGLVKCTASLAASRPAPPIPARSCPGMLEYGAGAVSSLPYTRPGSVKVGRGIILLLAAQLSLGSLLPSPHVGPSSSLSRRYVTYKTGTIFKNWDVKWGFHALRINHGR